MALSEALNEQLWFAGEAVHETLRGTTAGAWEANDRSADAAIKRLSDSKPVSSKQLMSSKQLERLRKRAGIGIGRGK
jgi:hypothetical protein